MRTPITTPFKLLLFFYLLFPCTKIFSQDGQQLFTQNCGSCHSIFKPLVGPPLANFETHGPWADQNKLYEWIADPKSFMQHDQYTKGLFEQYGTMMQAFGSRLDHQQIDAITEYIQEASNTGPATTGPKGGSEPIGEDNGWITFAIITGAMAFIALILFQVNNSLKKLSQDKEGLASMPYIPFYRNKFYITIFSLIVFVAIGYYITKAGIGLGRQKSYQPKQPIYFSHKVHAGINQINCLYCHGNAWEGKTAAIPSVNVCMNCHRNIQSYQGPLLVDADGNQVDGSQEIVKLYGYANFDPAKPAMWNSSEAKPIQWIRIHNLPDHVYFNHSQHIRVGKVQCQTCHGPVTEMNEMRQFAELSMGWCVNCHRQTKTDFYVNDSVGNKFYKIYDKLHAEIIQHEIDSVSVKEVGGIECQKCHY